LDYLLALPAGCAAALCWANTLPDSYYRFARASTFLVNEVGLVFFFALITKEVAEATLPGGALAPDPAGLTPGPRRQPPAAFLIGGRCEWTRRSPFVTSRHSRHWTGRRGCARGDPER
jgi:hypothetical protein